MAEEMLEEIIETERAIASRLEAEKASVEKWLEETRQRLEREISEEEEKLRSECERAVEQASRTATGKAEKLVREAQKIAEALDALEDETVGKIVCFRLMSIVPSHES